MKFTLNQLKKYLNINKTTTEIAHKLTMLGLEIEEIKDNETPLLQFIIAEIKEVQNHPDADKLHILKVDSGEKILNIVCGAPNVHAGLKGILARPNDIIPTTGDKLSKGKIRGVESEAMMCSMRELGLGLDHDGIIDLPENFDANAGDPALPHLKKLYDIDTIFEAEVTPNRPDYLSVKGIAADLAAGGYGELIDQATIKVNETFDCPISVLNEIPETVPQFCVRYIKDVKNQPSPTWLVNYLNLLDMKNISALVDITNYTLHQLSRPLHVFDADKIKGNLKINYAVEGEEFQALDGNMYKLANTDIVIRDDKGIISLAGIMGGITTAADMNTKNILLESAYFNPSTIRRTAKRLGIESDSKYRFERGIDPKNTISGLDFATQHIIEFCGGTASKSHSSTNYKYTEVEINFDPKYFESLIGFVLPKPEMINILKSLGCKIEDKGNLIITPPSYRQDISEPHDVVEELIRIAGYDRLKPISLPISNTQPNISVYEEKISQLPRLLANRNMTEVYTWSFMSDKKELDKATPAITLLNPITNDLNVMRKSIIPNLLDGIMTNLARSIPSSSIFEIAPTFISAEPNTEHLTVAGVRQGASSPMDWSNSNPKKYDFYDVKNDVINILELFKIDYKRVKFQTDNLPTWLNPYKSARVVYGNKDLGLLGELHPNTIKMFGIKHTIPVVFELNLDNFKDVKPRKTIAKSKLNLSEFQTTTRDFAFIFDDNVKAEDVINTIMKINPILISNVVIFDVYKGEKLPPQKKSIAINITLTPMDKTLTDDEIKSTSDKIISAIEKLGGDLRK